MKENKSIKFIVLSLGQALSAGFVPDGTLLRHKSGASISQQTLENLSGSVVEGKSTGNAEFPVVAGGTILHKSLVALQTGTKTVEQAGGDDIELVKFENGTLYVVTGSGDYQIEGFDAPASAEQA
jgi:hypothetical protein